MSADGSLASSTPASTLSVLNGYFDQIEPHLSPEVDLHSYEDCGWFVRKAGIDCGRLGCAKLLGKSVGLASFCDSPEIGISDYLCHPNTALKFLSECIEACSALDATVNTQEKELGRPNVRTPTISAPSKRRAYAQWHEAYWNLGEGTSYKEAYTLASVRAREQSEKIAVFETWTRYVRVMRKLLGDSCFSVLP